MNNNKQMQIATVTLNPALDQTVNIAQFQVGQVNRVYKQRIDPGGKGINVAKVIHSLGHSVCVTGFLGQDNCHIFYEYLRRAAIDHHFVEVAGATRMNIKIVDDYSGQVSEINFPGLSCMASDADKLESVINALALDHQWFVISGSLPQGVPDDIYRKLITVLQRRGAKVFLDASGCALREGIAAKPYAIKPNLTELSELIGRPLAAETEIKKAIGDVLAGGVERVIVTLGEQGAIAANKNGMFMVKPPVVKAKSTVGAGDAMVAGFVVGEARGLALVDCVRLGTAAATASVIQPGTQAGSAEQVAAMIAQVQVSSAG